MRDTDTAQRILDIAERLVQTQGYNGFSYADISDELKIKKASLHYHFPTKADLGERLIARYRDVFGRLLAEIDAREPSARKKLDAYVALYAAVLSKNRLCLCGMLAADFGTLPKAMREGLRGFFDENEVWLTKVLEEGRKSKTLKFEGTPTVLARLLVSALEGAMMIARSYGDPERFEAIARRLLVGL